MNSEERDLVNDLFQRLKSVDVASKDREAEDLITKRIGEQPSASYVLVQTLLVHQHALNNAQGRIAQLEADLAEAKKPQGEAASKSSFLGDMERSGPWGTRAAPSAAQGSASQTAPAPTSAPSRFSSGPMSPTAPSSGGGFLQSALATAAGVAGGALMFEGIRSLFAHNPGPFGGAPGTAWSQPGAGHETTSIRSDANPGDVQVADAADESDTLSDANGDDVADFDSSDDSVA